MGDIHGIAYTALRDDKMKFKNPRQRKAVMARIAAERKARGLCTCQRCVKHTHTVRYLNSIGFTKLSAKYIAHKSHGRPCKR